MTKPVTILFALAGILLPLAEAKACKEGLDYWDYLREIDNELKRVGLPTQDPYERHSLFHCSSDGWIRWNVYCGNCIDGGSGKDDFCR
ncbi:hypothetical protein CHGG_10891 [Chaetomium globosum CBS 148.51]|uniref:Uncharacterized protein n=1 Tax=Chaetomium globosum (strain ATCC 6205 / CBS 148.51 / DSM 1962 / NBRC 6347 / NRRL 1970) TaxID=306901 RepID=Q2GMB3_CHAGB|nr:uncharacterized protein CHGG_10891 [Chaetomium globosum CBS 148.51]EAQ83073.1 hypothetical protein CHGG_10891 [Chaetomium globosum CBS 148.51]